MRTLREVEDAVRGAWGADTCSPDDAEREPWRETNPAWGQCDVTALVVHDLLGGDLMCGEVRTAGGGPRGYHWWNRLASGLEVDLTREQFRAGEAVTPGRVVPRPWGRTLRRAEEYEALRGRVASRLGPDAVVGDGTEDEPVRAALDVAGRQLSYLDFGGPGRPLLALHGHFQDAGSYAALARELRPGWRVIAPDQRGHGASDSAGEFTREGYVADAEAVLTHLGGGPVPVVGHSLGGVNAYQLAARHPELVSALVVEEAGAVVAGDLSFALEWPHRASTRRELLRALGASYGYLADAVREFADGWGLVFRPEDMVASKEALNGDHWRDWLASTVATCPALLVRGIRSDVLDAAHAREMVAARPGARLAELHTGHTVRATDPVGFAESVRGFLAEVNEPS